MNRNYAMAALFVMTSVAYAEKTPARILKDTLRKEYEEGLTKVAKEDLKRLEDALKYAAKSDLRIFQDCIKGKDIEDQGRCKVYDDNAAMRKENLNVVDRAKGSLSGFAKKVIREIIVEEQDPRVLPRIQDPHEAEYRYRKSNPEHLAPGDLSAGEEWMKLQRDLVDFNDDFIYKASKAIVPDAIEPKWDELSRAERTKARDEYDRARQQVANQRTRTASEVKKIVGIPEPKGFWEKGLDRLRTRFFGQKPDRSYADYVEQLIGTPRRPYGDYPLDK
jgi:hypothetical protein